VAKALPNAKAIIKHTPCGNEVEAPAKQNNKKYIPPPRKRPKKIRANGKQHPADQGTHKREKYVKTTFPISPPKWTKHVHPASQLGP